MNCLVISLDIVLCCIALCLHFILLEGTKVQQCKMLNLSAGKLTAQLQDLSAAQQGEVPFLPYLLST